MEKTNGVSQERVTTMCLTSRRVKRLQTLLMASSLFLLVHGDMVRTEGALADTYVTTFRGGALGAYTFTFDDGAVGQWQYAVPTLKGYDIHGTFFLIGASVEAWYSTIGRIHVPEMLSMAAAGHEIGSHTYNHLSLVDVNDADAHAQMALNQEFFKKWGINVVSMAYPHSATNTRVRSIVAQYVEFARDGDPRVTNSSSWQQLNALDLKWSSQDNDHYGCVDAAIATKTWAIGVFHEIGAAEGPTADDFAAIAAYVATRRNAGDLWVDTVKEVAPYIRERSSAIITNKYDAKSQTIMVGLKTGLKYPYIVPLTLRTSIDKYGMKAVSQTEMAVPYKVMDDGTGRVVQYDVIPDAGNVTIELMNQASQ